MRKIFVILSLVVFTYSCVVEGWTNDYNTLNEFQKKKITAIEDFRDLKKGLIYKINGQQLREELKNHPKSIVYIFSNGCSSELCKPISVYEEFAMQNEYHLFLIMNGFTNIESTLKQSFTSVLFVMDNEYYNEKRNYKYSRYFENDLLKRSLKEKNNKYSGNLYFFQGDSLVQILKELPKN